MKSAICLLALASGIPAMGQSSAASHTYTHPLGFSYSVPSDWEVTDPNANLAEVKKKTEETATSEGEKKGIDCMQVGLTARHEGSVIIELDVPFDCYGQTFADKDLPEFGSGVFRGLEKTFNMNDPVFGVYALEGHHLWIERARATAKENPSQQYTVETACVMVKKAAVCWMVRAADDTALAVFEHGAVTLEDDSPAALVPANAFASKPM